MKGLLVFLLLISFVINVDPHKPTAKNNTKSVVEDEPPLPPDDFEREDGQEDPNPECEGGIIENGKCICPKNKKLLNGVCTYSPLSNKCKNGIFFRDRCICHRGFKLKGKLECVKDNKCIGGRIVNGVCKSSNVRSTFINRQPQCKKGELIFYGKCRSRGSCPEGQYEVNGKCIGVIKNPTIPYCPPNKVACPPKRYHPFYDNKDCDFRKHYASPYRCNPLFMSGCPPGRKKVGNTCIPNTPNTIRPTLHLRKGL